MGIGLESRSPIKHKQMRMKQSLVILLALSSLLQAGDTGSRVLYVGGTVPGLTNKSTARIEMPGDDALKFNSRGNSFAIPYKDVDTLEYGTRLGVRHTRITVRDTASRWGSCSVKRSLSYSWRLILAPAFVLDYVVAHEVAHMREMNHGPVFWRLVKDLVGDPRKAQNWLRDNGAALHRYAPKG